MMGFERSQKPPGKQHQNTAADRDGRHDHRSGVWIRAFHQGTPERAGMEMISGKKLDADSQRELLTLLNNAEARLLFPHFYN